MNEQMKEKHLDAFMDTAYRFAELSEAVRARVGAIIVKDRRIISIGYNGMPSGWDNCCEDKEYMSNDACACPDTEEINTQWPYKEYDAGTHSHQRYRLKTKPQVLHAEANAIAKLAQSPESAKDAVLFCTHMPCMECAKLIHQSGIRTVYYGEQYVAAKGSGEEFLSKSGITLYWLPTKPKTVAVKTVERIVEVDRIVEQEHPKLWKDGHLLPPMDWYTVSVKTNADGKETLSVRILKDTAYFSINAKYNWDEFKNDIVAVNNLFKINTWNIDYSYEGHLIHYKHAQGKLIFNILHDNITEINKIIGTTFNNWNLIHGNYFVKTCYDDWCNTNNIKEKMNIVDSLYNLFFHRYLKSCITKYDLSKIKLVKADVSKHYCTFNGRPSYDRVGLLKKLYKGHLLDKGYSTWHFDDETWDILNQELPQLPKKNYLPDTCLDSVKHYTSISTQWNQNSEQEIIKSYKDSLFEIVTETISHIDQETYNRDSTRFGRLPLPDVPQQIPHAHTVFFTEKTARPLFWGMPFFVISGHHSLKSLRDLGFKTFSDIWDESYDNIADPDQRMQAVFDSISEVANRPLIQLEKDIARHKDILLHNQQRFKEIATLKPLEFWQEMLNARVNGVPDRTMIGQLREPNMHIRQKF